MLRGRLKTRTSRAADPASAPAIAKQSPRFQKRSQASQRHMAPSGCALLLAASFSSCSRTRAGLRRAPPQDAQALRFHSALLISIFAAPSGFWRMSVILGGAACASKPLSCVLSKAARAGGAGPLGNGCREPAMTPHMNEERWDALIKLLRRCCAMARRNGIEFTALAACCGAHPLIDSGLKSGFSG